MGFSEHRNLSFTEQVTRHWTAVQPTVRAFLLATVYDSAAVDDVLQNVAMTVVRRFDQYESGTDFAAWVITIARNKVMDYNKAQRRDRHLFDAQLYDRLGQVAVQVASELDCRHRALRECIAKMPENQRTLLDMRYRDQLSVQAIAESRRARPNTITVALRRIRVALRGCIERRLVGGEG